MDRNNAIQQVLRALEEEEDMVASHKADQKDLDAFTESQLREYDKRRIEGRRADDKYISEMRDYLDKLRNTRLSEIAKSASEDLIALLNKALNDQRASFEHKLEKERATLNDLLRQSREEVDLTIMAHRQAFNSVIEQTREHLVELVNKRLKLKTLIESIPLEDVHANLNVG
jgi:LPS O-antigen subunit length determinant protein (WzzB/FepE family)